ncbi:unnamed protein product [Pedinophyceae sp. YPF-701]|nr:unnamed protein product [Pedinophyceae sp. YPF-701]
MEALLAEAGALGKDAAKEERRDVWQRCAETAAREGLAGKHEEAVKAVCDTLGPFKGDPAAQHAVEAFVRTAVSDAAFMKTLAGMLVKLETKAAKMSACQCRTAAAWAASVLGALELPAMAKAARALCAAQCSLLDAAVTADPTAALRCVDMAVRCAASRDDALPDMYRAAADAKQSTTALLAGCSERDALLTAYVERVLGPRQPAPAGIVACWQRFVEELEGDDVAAKLAAAVGRQMKRSPEVVLAPLAGLLAGLPSADDAFAVVDGAVAEITAQLRHADEGRRERSAACLGAMAGRARTDAELALSFGEVVRGMESKAFKTVLEKSGALLAMARVGEAAPRALECPGAAATASALLATAASAEANEGLKLTALRALTSWVPRCRGGVPKEVEALASAGLQTKDAVLRANLAAVCAAVSAPTGAADALAEIAPALCKITAEGHAKPTKRAEGVYSLTALAHLAVAQPSALDAMSSAGVWPAYLQGDAPLVSAATAAKLSGGECQAAAQLAAVLLSPGGLLTHARAADGVVPAAAALLTACMAHRDAAVRRLAHDRAAAVLVQDPALSGTLAGALLAWMDDPTALHTLPEGEAAAGEALADAAVACAPRSLQGVPADAFASLLLALHWPIKVEGENGGTPLHGLPDGAAAFVAANAAAIATVLSGDAGLGAQGDARAARRSAACNAFGSMLGLAADATYPLALERAARLLDRTAHDGMSQMDVLIYNAPEGTLAADTLPTGAFLPDLGIEGVEVKLTAVGKVAKDRGIDDDDDSGRKAGGGAGRGKGRGGAGGRGGRGKGQVDAQEAARLADLAEEAAVRARLVEMRKTLDLGLELVGAMAIGAPTFVADRLDDLGPLVTPLLASPVVGDSSASECSALLAGSLPDPLAEHRRAVGQALRIVAVEDDPTRNDAVVEAVKALAGAVAATRRPLPSPTYHFVFPVLRAVLGIARHSPAHEPALDVVARHAAPGMDVPRAETLRQLYALAAAVPAFRDRIEPVLHQLCAGCDDDELLPAARGLLSPAAFVRAMALRALPSAPSLGEGVPPADPAVVVLLLMACNDPFQDNRAPATALWAQSGCTVPEDFCAALLPHVCSPHTDVREAAAASLSAALADHPTAAEQTLTSLLALYAPGSADARAADVAARLGCAASLAACAPQMPPAQIMRGVSFLLSTGLADPDESVRARMSEAGVAMVDAHGGSVGRELLPLLEAATARDASGAAADQATADLVREGAVVMLGTLARHMDDQGKMRGVVEALVEALGIPSESVQRAVFKCLAPLVARLKSDAGYAEELVGRMRTMTLQDPAYGRRRGGAFGLAAMVVGLGIPSLKTHGIMDALCAGVEHKRDARQREGALFAFAALCESLGRRFEPYVIHLLPRLLNCFSDPAEEVREAADEAARAIMAHLSAHGVKMVLPALMRGLTDSAWRTKQGSVQLLGAMSHCAPKQLSSCLPQIIPRLSEVITDPHTKVQAAARGALSQIGETIRSPEIKELVPVLLGALADPRADIRRPLDAVLTTTFVSTVDAASLALIVPIVSRGLKDRAGDVKKRSARIVGSMCNLLTDPADMAPYLPPLMPDLRKGLVDASPEVRATCAKALGSLVRGMGAAPMGDLVPWLLSSLRSDGSSVQRQGAAQGLAEVLAVLGPENLEALLPEVYVSCRSGSAAVREGHLVLLRFLPMTLDTDFQPHLSATLRCILDGLADEVESVRDAAMKAGRTLVEMFALSSLTMLLPAVEGGVFNANHRIRQASVDLLGELLYRVSGQTGRLMFDDAAAGDDEVGMGTQLAPSVITDRLIAKLGSDRWESILARIYMARADVALGVRTSALNVWKVFVSNTPRVLNEILPRIMQLVIGNLADPEEERRLMAGRAVGELVKKMGERVVARVVPILRNGMTSPDTATRQGVCYGLREVLESMGRQQLAEHLPTLLPAVQAALVDQDEDVREAAGGAFSSLFRGGAASVVENVVPGLVRQLGSAEHAANALEGLRVILGTKPRAIDSVLPRLLPKNSAPEQAHVTALAQLAPAAAEALPRHVPFVLATLLPLASRADAAGAGMDVTALEALVAVATAVSSEAETEIYPLVSELVRALERPETRLGAARLVGSWAKAARTFDLSEHVPLLLSSLIALFSADDPAVLAAALDAVRAVTATLEKEVLPAHVRIVCDAVQTARDAQRRKESKAALPGAAADQPVLIPGLCQPRALQPLLPIYLQGLLAGASSEVREMAANGLGELVAATSADALKPFVVQIAGPLIRTVGDRFVPEVKAAVLGALGVLVARGGAALKPFVPQLQTSFLKCLHDGSKPVRDRAAVNLGALAAMSLRADQLAGDLATQAGTVDRAVAQAMLAALRGLLLSCGPRLKPETLAKVGGAVADILRAQNDEDALLRVGAAGCLGAYAACCDDAALQGLLGTWVLDAAPVETWHGVNRAAVLAAAAKHAAQRMLGAAGPREVGAAVVRASRHERDEAKKCAGRALAALACADADFLEHVQPVLPTLLGPDQFSDVQRSAQCAIRHVAQAHATALEAQWGELLPPMVALATLKSGPDKLYAERTLGRLLGLAQGDEGHVLQYAGGGAASSGVRTHLTPANVAKYAKYAQQGGPEDDVFDEDEW